MPLQKESKRGLLALVVLCVAGLAAFAAVASSGPARAKDAVAARLQHAR